MKTKLISISGEKSKDIELPKIFLSKVRMDILKKAFESEQAFSPYGPNKEAGKRHSASGTIRHLRHVWKSGYGRGTSRTPRKAMWRRGSQFYWIGAEVPNTRGGRRAHPPKPEGTVKIRKINKKEFKIAFDSAIASTASPNYITERYARISDLGSFNFPLVIDSKIASMNTKELSAVLEKSLGGLFSTALKGKKLRAGKGKMRNRKYKKSAGILIISSSKENIRTTSFNSKKLNELMVSDLYPAGRLAVYTEGAIKELEERK
ncbi:50S ribosomal protein L4 [Candidatus Pacearchaeota archaeon]|nr:ribosomal protein L4/L1e [uncultured archaeon]MBS3099945.1 50S ribosomal protein L4 [Candidatus Pacearchaeota archaeon]